MKYQDIPGWLSDQESYFLTAQAVGKDCIEIGSFKGRSTVCLAATAKSVIAIDPHRAGADGQLQDGDTYQDFLNNTSEYKNIIPMRMTSEEAAPHIKDNSVDLVWIDGMHDYENVKKDIENYLPKLKVGGVIAFHDYLDANNWSGVWKSTHEKFGDTLQRADTIGWTIKKAESPKIETRKAWWESIFKRNGQKLIDRRKSFYYEKHADVTAYISTKGRNKSTLQLALMGILQQSLLPKFIYIIDDNEICEDPNHFSVYRNILQMFMDRGVQWFWIPGEKKGQVANHQKMLYTATTEWVWRIDDDEVAEQDCLKNMCKHCSDDKVGAVGPLVICPDPNFYSQGYYEFPEHLHSTFMYRRQAASHYKELSIVGHREETIFTMDIKRKGWKLVIEPTAVVHHLRESSGGIRSTNDQSNYEHDEGIYQRYLMNNDAGLKSTKWVNLDCGIGDTICAKRVIEKMIKNHPDMTINVACAHPSFIEDLQPKINIVSVAHGKMVLGETKFQELNIYNFMMYNNWKTSLISAFEKLYEN